MGGSNGGMLEGIGLNVGDGAFVVDRSGNLTLKGNITWGKDTFPVQSQFSVDGSSNWHDTQTSSDKYRRDKLYNGTWGTPYQFKGTDGRPGSDANVTFNNILRALQAASNTKTTFITADSVGAPTIYGAKIYGAEIYAGGVDDEGGQIVGLSDSGIIIYDGRGNMVLNIHESNGGAHLTTGFNYLNVSAPYVNFSGASNISFSSLVVDFSKVGEVRGIRATFA